MIFSNVLESLQFPSSLLIYIYILKCKTSLTMQDFRSFTKFIIGPMLLFGHYVDLIKDTILVYRLQLALGGFATVFYFHNRFSCAVSIVQYFS